MSFTSFFSEKSVINSDDDVEMEFVALDAARVNSLSKCKS